MIQTFCKEEKLRGKTSFEKLVKEGYSLYQFPFRMLYLPKNSPKSDLGFSKEQTLSPPPYPARLGISVPKRKFKKAVDRNRIKRIIRESYRKQKETLLYPFLMERGLIIDILIVYTHNEILDSKSIYTKIQSLIGKFRKEYKNENS